MIKLLLILARSNSISLHTQQVIIKFLLNFYRQIRQLWHYSIFYLSKSKDCYDFFALNP